MFERFTDRARQVVVRAQEQARVLNHSYIGTEHLLLGLIREGEGVAAQVLIGLGADLNRVRRQVLGLLHGWRGTRPHPVPVPWEPAPLPGVRARLDAFEKRLAAIEERVGTGPDTEDLDEQIERVRGRRQAAADAQEYEQAAALRDQERQLIAGKAGRQEEWAAGHPGLPSLAEQCRQLSREVDRLRALLRRHGIEPEDEPA